MKVINNFGGLVQGKLTVVFRNTVTEEQVKQIIEDANCKLDSFNSQCFLARASCLPGKEAQAIMTLTVPGFSQASRVVKGRKY